MRCFLSLLARTVPVFTARVSKTTLIKILCPNATILSPVIQKKQIHQEMFSFSLEPQLRGPKVRDFICLCICLLFINDAIGSSIIQRRMMG